MGVGNLSRRVGMNEASKGTRKSLNEAMDAGVASKRPQKRERKEVTVSSITDDIKALVADFAAVEAELKVLNEQRAALKERATQLSLEHGIDDFTGDEGKVQVIVKTAPTTFDKKKARQYLTEEQYTSCLKQGKPPAPTVKFVPASKE